MTWSPTRMTTTSKTSGIVLGVGQCERYVVISTRPFFFVHFNRQPLDKQSESRASALDFTKTRDSARKIA